MLTQWCYWKCCTLLARYLAIHCYSMKCVCYCVGCNNHCHSVKISLYLLNHVMDYCELY